MICALQHQRCLLFVSTPSCVAAPLPGMWKAGEMCEAGQCATFPASLVLRAARPTRLCALLDANMVSAATNAGPHHPPLSAALTHGVNTGNRLRVLSIEFGGCWSRDVQPQGKGYIMVYIVFVGAIGSMVQRCLRRFKSDRTMTAHPTCIIPVAGSSFDFKVNIKSHKKARCFT